MQLGPQYQVDVSSLEVDFTARAKTRLLGQFQQSPVLAQVLSAFSAECQELLDATVGMIQGRMLAYAQGYNLAALGRIVGQVPVAVANGSLIYFTPDTAALAPDISRAWVPGAPPTGTNPPTGQQFLAQIMSRIQKNMNRFSSVPEVQNEVMSAFGVLVSFTLDPVEPMCVSVVTVQDATPIEVMQYLQEFYDNGRAELIPMVGYPATLRIKAVQVAHPIEEELALTPSEVTVYSSGALVSVQISGINYYTPWTAVVDTEGVTLAPDDGTGDMVFSVTVPADGARTITVTVSTETQSAECVITQMSYTTTTSTTTTTTTSTTSTTTTTTTTTSTSTSTSTTTTTTTTTSTSTSTSTTSTTTAAPPPSGPFCVAGAGTTAVNGTYNYAGLDGSGNPYYMNANGYYLAWSDYQSIWLIPVVLDVGPVLYDAPATLAGGPSAGTWVVRSGASPAPTVITGACGA